MNAERKMEELAQRFARLEAQNLEMARALEAQAQRTEQAEANLREAARQVDALRSSAAASAAASALFGPPIRSAVDTRTLGKPHSFSGRREGWREFRFVFEAFACAAHPGMELVLRRAETMNDQVIDSIDLDEETGSLSKQLYYMLVMLTTDDAHRLLINIEQGNGADAWRRLCWEYEPNVRVRHGAVLHGLLRREFGKDQNADLAVEIETFERDVRRWEEQSGKTLDSDIKASVLMGNMANTRVKDHLELNAARLDTYKAVRGEILNFAVAKRTWTQDVHDDPMQIGAVKGKGKEKAKGKSKGKAKDPGSAEDSLKKKGSGKSGDPAAGKDKECHYCKKKGHFKVDCRKLKAAAAAGKVDPKGKPLPGTANPSGSTTGARSVISEGSGSTMLPLGASATASSAPSPPPGINPYGMWYPMMMPTPMQAILGPGVSLPTTTPMSPTPSPSSAHDAPWMIMMIQPPMPVASVRPGEIELALIDSGSGVVACPRNYAPEIPLVPPRGDHRPMVSATNEPIQVFGKKVAYYLLVNGEEMAITWTVTNVNCLILAANVFDAQRRHRQLV